MEVGGCVQVALGIFVCGKSFPNSPKPVLIFWSSIPCVFGYIHCKKLLVITIGVFSPCRRWVSKFFLGWGGLVV